MFEKFTDRARQVVVVAQEESRQLQHAYIGTEHLLLALAREQDGATARVLESFGITAERVRAQVVRLVGRGPGAAPDQIPFTPRGKKVLELALRESLSLGHHDIGPEHLLLGLVREGEGVAMRILLDLNVDSEAIRDAVVSWISREPQPSEEAQMARMARGRRRRGDATAVRVTPPEPPGRGDDAGVLLARIEREIRARLHREPDNGDLLVILACLPEGVVARTLAELGVDDAGLDAALERARAAGPDLIEDQIAVVQRRKDEAIDRGELDEAVAARARERELLTTAEQSDLLAQVRVRLGLSPQQPSGPPA